MWGNNYPMGLTVSERQLHISVVWGGDQVCLVLCEDGKPEKRYPMDPGCRQGNVWNLTLESEEGWPRNLEYTLELDGKRQADPYARCILGLEENVPRSPVFPEYYRKDGVYAQQPLVFDWEEDQPLRLPYENCVIYKAHVRGLTMGEGRRYLDKGTFRGVQGKIPYLKELGITTLELMPVMEFDDWLVSDCSETPKRNYWGYGGGYYFAPKAAYSKEHGAYELKQLVKALHQAGIELVLQFYFDGSEAPGFVLDVLRYWTMEYHLDGIHLVGPAPIQQISLDPYIQQVKLWADHWDGMNAGRSKRLAEYHDGYCRTMRCFLKGDGGQTGDAAYWLHRNPADTAVIKYMANTNGMTLADMVTYQERHNEANGEANRDGTNENFCWNCGVEGPSRRREVVQLRRKQRKNAALLLLLSQGVPLLQAGDECLNSQNGNNNPYCQDNAIGWVTWKKGQNERAYQKFIRDCIAFRRKHPVLSQARVLTGKDLLGCGLPEISWHGLEPWKPQFEEDSRELAVLYAGAYAKDCDLFFIYNMYWEPQIFGLPKQPGNRRWHLVIDTGRPEAEMFAPEGKELLLEEQRNYTAVPRSVIVFIGK